MAPINPRNRPQRLWDYHANVLSEESKLHESKIVNLLERWDNRAKEGFLPLSEKTGIFQGLRSMRQSHVRRLSIFTDNRLKRWKTRSFEDIIEMTDKLRDLHFSLAVAERCFWQRLEGYEAAAVDSVRRGTFSEAGGIQQILNASDYLCTAYWDKIFGKGKSDWCGIVVFGQFHEFRNLRPYIFAPDYVKLYNFKTWVYFVHEVMHGAVETLSSKKEFQSIRNELIDVFSAVPFPELKRTDEEYLAEETICDIMATLAAGETYIKTLSTLKYYPPIIVFSKKDFFERLITYPMLLRTLISGWTIKIAWGFAKDISDSKVSFKEKSSIHALVKSVWREDEIEARRAISFLETSPSLLKAILSDPNTIEDVYERLMAAHQYELALKWSVIPFVVKETLRRNIIPRIKALVADDYYHTDPKHCFHKINYQRKSTSNLVMQIDTSLCDKTANASEVHKKKSEKRATIQSIVRTLLKNQLVTDANPVDIISGLNQLANRRGGDRSKFHEHVAILSISSQPEYHHRRFGDYSVDKN